jgi:hypothetical protein
MASFISFLASAFTEVERHLAAFTAIIAAVAVVQWRETRVSSRRQLRAYIFPEGANVMDGSSLNPVQTHRINDVGIAFAIKNSGQTPAFDVLHWVDIDVRETAKEALLATPTKLDRKSLLHLPPGATSHKFPWLNRTLSAQEISDILSGVRAIYLHGKIEYVDAFGKKRRTNYRLKYNGVYPPIGGSGMLMYCDEGNEAN